MIEWVSRSGFLYYELTMLAPPVNQRTAFWLKFDPLSLGLLVMTHQLLKPIPIWVNTIQNTTKSIHTRKPIIVISSSSNAIWQLPLFGHYICTLRMHQTLIQMSINTSHVWPDIYNTVHIMWLAWKHYNEHNTIFINPKELIRFDYSKQIDSIWNSYYIKRINALLEKCWYSHPYYKAYTEYSVIHKPAKLLILHHIQMTWMMKTKLQIPYSNTLFHVKSVISKCITIYINATYLHYMP